MNNNNFSQELKKRMPFAEWSWLLLALRQDEGVWSALEKTSLGERALEALPAEPKAWSPAALALLDLEDPAALEALHLPINKSLEEKLLQKASRVYEAWIKDGQTPVKLVDAGLLALTFREQHKLGVSWGEALRSQRVESPTFVTLMVCLYGMVPEPLGLLLELCQSAQADWVKLGVHALLSNPHSPEDQLVLFESLIAKLAPASTLLLLQTLSSMRPNLAALLSRQAIKNMSDTSGARFEKSESSVGSDYIGELIQTLRIAEVHQISGQTDLAVPALAESLRVARKIRGHISAQLAHSVARTKDVNADGWGNTAEEASLEAWKQAIQFAPDEANYASGYASAMMKAGRLSDAAAYLKNITEKEAYAPNPRLYLTYAQVLHQLGDDKRSLQLALHALELVQEGKMISESEWLDLVGLLMKNDQFKAALTAAHAGLNEFPTSRDLFALSAKIHFLMGNPEDALSSAFAAQAAGSYAESLGEETVVESADSDRISYISSMDLQRVLIDSLEALGSWDAAYTERLAMLEGQSEPESKELKDLALCAFSAERYDHVIEIGKKLLQEDPEDLDLHRQIAEAAQALGDADTAIQYYSHLLQIAPDDAQAWRGLVRVQNQAGLEADAFESLRAASMALPGDSEIQLELGELYLSQGSPTLALPCFRRAVEGEPSGLEELIWVRLAETLHQLGRNDEARQVLEPVYDKLSEFFSSVKDYSVEDKKAKNSSSYLAHEYARTLVGLGEPEKAIPILAQILKEHGDDPFLSLDLAQALMQLSDKASGARRAIPFLQKILGIGPDGVIGAYSSRLDDSPEARGKARALLADAYSEVGDWNKAMDAYRRALEEPANSDSRMKTRLSTGLGMTALKLELPEMAVAALQEAAHAEPLNGQIQRNLCEAYIANGLSQDAFQAATSALELASSEINTLVWFIDQGARIAALPGSAAQPILTEVIHVLRIALQKSPERADLLIKLGQLLIQTGSRVEAMEAFKKLASLDLSSQLVSLKELSQAVELVQESGDYRLAVILLRKAIAKLESQSLKGDSGEEDVSLTDLYIALVKAFERLGDLDGALEAINEGLNIDQAQIAFHKSRADLLFRLGKLEEARAGLEEALQRWPDQSGLHYRMAQTLQALGDLPAALQHAETGIAGLDESRESPEARGLYLYASGLAYATLRSRRAYAYLQKVVSESDPDYSRFENAVFRAELALEAGEIAAAEKAVSLFEEQAASSARAMAVCGLVACRRGDREEGERKCRSAVRMWTKQQMGSSGRTPAKNEDAFIAELSSIGTAALESRQWKDALAVFRQAVELFPDKPRSHYLLAEALMKIGEAQALCQDLDIVIHAPGADCLSDKSRREFEDCLNAAAAKVGAPDILRSDGILDHQDVEVKRSLGVCARRGRAVFNPVLENATSLEYLLQTIMPEINDLAALIMAYRRCGEVDIALKASRVGWHPVFNSHDCHKDPRVVIQLSLTQPDIRSAIDLLMDVMATPYCLNAGWPEMPMMHYLLARHCFHVNDFPVAQQAIKQALEEWPEEPRWHALAGKITLSLPAENRLQQLADAVDCFEKAASLEPENGAHQLSLGEIYLETGQGRRALGALEKATRLEAENSAGWLALAKAQHAAGEFDQAASSAERAVELSEDPVEALLLRADTALKTNNYRGALNRAQAVLRTHPEHPRALYLLARSLEGLNRPTEALEALERALSIYENPVPMQLEKLQLIKRSQGLEAGLKALQEMVSKNPKQAAFLALLAEWFHETGKTEAATQTARLALQDGLEGLTDRKRADLKAIIGFHLRRSGQLDQAIQYLSEAIADSSDHLEAYLELGRVYHDRREYQQALKIYQKAINLASDDFRPYHLAGMALKDNKDYMAAEAMLRRAAEIAPNDLGVHRLLGAVVALNLVHSHRLTPSRPK